MTWDWAIDLVAKALTVGVTAVAGSIIAGTSPVQYQLLAMVFAYSVWTQIIVPRVEDWFNGGQTAVDAPTKSRFELL